MNLNAGTSQSEQMVIIGSETVHIDVSFDSDVGFVTVFTSYANTHPENITMILSQYSDADRTDLIGSSGLAVGVATSLSLSQASRYFRFEASAHGHEGSVVVGVTPFGASL